MCILFYFYPLILRFKCSYEWQYNRTLCVEKWNKTVDEWWRNFNNCEPYMTWNETRWNETIEYTNITECTCTNTTDSSSSASSSDSSSDSVSLSSDHDGDTFGNNSTSCVCTNVTVPVEKNLTDWEYKHGICAVYWNNTPVDYGNPHYVHINLLQPIRRDSVPGGNSTTDGSNIVIITFSIL